MIPHAEQNGMTTQGGLDLPRVPDPADEDDVLREQLEYLIAHVAERGVCGCPECQRYLRVRSVLLEIFSEPEPQSAQQLTALPMAA
jgi:hypothetical protein